MNLNKFHKQAFTRAVLDDVPKIDHMEEATKVLTAFRVSKMAKEVRAVWDNPELRGLLSISNSGVHFGFSYIHVVQGAAFPAAVMAEVKTLEQAYFAQKKARDTLQAKLDGVLASIRTRSRLIELFPEFEKYAPADVVVDKSAHLPAIANLVTDLMDAGWPKGKPKPTKKK